MKKLVIMGALLAISNGLSARQMHTYNFTDVVYRVKADVANAGDTNILVDPVTKKSAGVFGCEGINDVRSVEADGKYGKVKAENGFSACYSREVFVTPQLDASGTIVGIDLEVR